MIKFDQLLLPLVGGYLFLITFHFTRFFHQRIESQKLIFNSIIAGALISLLGLYLKELLNLPCLICFKKLLIFLTPLDYDGLRTSFFIFAISYPLARVFNRFSSRELALAYTIDRWGDVYEKIFWNSLGNEQNLIMITTKTHKVYVGYLSNISEPLKNSYVTIIPSFSGYRDKETLVFKITTDYIETLDKFLLENRINRIEDIIGITIPTSEINAVSKFIPELFQGFKNSEKVTKKKMRKKI